MSGSGRAWGCNSPALLDYLHAYDDVPDARRQIGRYLEFYNSRRPHSSLDRRTPDQAYFDPLPLRMAAKPRQTFHLTKRISCSNNRGHLSSRRR